MSFFHCLPLLTLDSLVSHSSALRPLKRGSGRREEENLGEEGSDKAPQREGALRTLQKESGWLPTGIPFPHGLSSSCEQPEQDGMEMQAAPSAPRNERTCLALEGSVCLHLCAVNTFGTRRELGSLVGLGCLLIWASKGQGNITHKMAENLGEGWGGRTSRHMKNQTK